MAKKRAGLDTKLTALINLYSQGKLEDAIEQARLLIKRFPREVILYNILGAASAGLGKFETAIKSYNRAIKLQPQKPEAYFNLGNVLRDKGDHSLAIKSYRKAININPTYKTAYNNLGTVLKDNGDIDAAIESYTQAIKIDPNYASAYNNLGVALQENNDLEGARANYSKAITLKPDYADAHTNLGVVLHKEGDPDAAIASHTRAIELEPTNSTLYNNLGVALRDKGDLDEALKSYSKALGLDPHSAEVHTNIGTLLNEQGDTEAAIINCKKGIQINPNYLQGYIALGNVFRDKNDIDAAIESYTQAIKIDPNYASAYNNLGAALQENKDVEGARTNYLKAITLKPDYADAHTNLGNVLHLEGNLDAAIASHTRAIELEPTNSTLHNNLGDTLRDRGDLDEALKSHATALELDPDNALIRLSQSLSMLTAGCFENTWEQYNSRWLLKKPATKPLKTSCPIWCPGEKRRVLLWPEQGLGDEIMFASLIRELSELCSQLIVQVDKRLLSLFRRSFPVDIDFRPKGVLVDENEYDAQIPMGNLCAFFRRNFGDFKRTSSGYLKAEKEKSNQIRNKILENGKSRICGISWYSRNPYSGSKRSLSLSNLLPPLYQEDIQFLNLQYGDMAEEISNLKDEYGIEVITIEEIDNFSNIDGLASLIDACDVVVSIDNSTVHLASAMGIDVRLLLPFHFCDWRWQFDRNDSYWYDSLKLYRQGPEQDWSLPIQHIHNDLQRIK